MRASRLDEPVFAELANTSGEDLISIFIPTHRAGREIAQDPIHLKNQLAAVEETLSDLGWKPRERTERLSSARSLLDDAEFWEHQSAGLAVFIDDQGEVTAVSSSETLEAHGAVMPVFMLRPLVADIHPIAAPVLVLTLDEVALFTATASSVERRDVDLPSFSDVNWFVDRESQRQQHSDSAGSSRNRHGHRDATRGDEDLARFMREVDSALTEFASDTALVVLGDDDIVARFSHHSGRDTVSPEKSGIWAPFSESRVHEMAAPTIEAMARSRVESVSENATDRLGIGMATTSVEEALAAAVSGRVGLVVIERNTAPVWGRLDETTMDVDRHQAKRPGDVDLLDRLVVWSRNNGASVISSESDVAGWPFIATFRY